MKEAELLMVGVCPKCQGQVVPEGKLHRRVYDYKCNCGFCITVPEKDLHTKGMKGALKDAILLRQKADEKPTEETGGQQEYEDCMG